MINTNTLIVNQYGAIYHRFKKHIDGHETEDAVNGVF